MDISLKQTSKRGLWQCSNVEPMTANEQKPLFLVMALIDTFEQISLAGEVN